ncbi:MAG: hypothetical protein ACYDCS_02710 [Candidatus Dormibacteria bacterium]
MASGKERLAALLRGLERRLGIDREGRTVWVWLLPPCIGVVSAVLVAFMPGLPNDVGWVYRLPFALFALLTMTGIASIYLITFDNDHNQQAAVDDEPGRGDDGPESPPLPSGSPPPRWLAALKVEDRLPEDTDHADESAARERVPAGVPH